MSKYTASKLPYTNRYKIRLLFPNSVRRHAVLVIQYLPRGVRKD